MCFPLLYRRSVKRSFRIKADFGETVAAKTCVRALKSGFFNCHCLLSNFQTPSPVWLGAHPLMQREGVSSDMMPYLTVGWQGDALSGSGLIWIFGIWPVFSASRYTLFCVLRQIVVVCRACTHKDALTGRLSLLSSLGFRTGSWSDSGSGLVGIQTPQRSRT